jgi:hypothetical protein
LKYDAGDPRLFVRFSSWSSATILERLQPLLDRVWAREVDVGALQSAVPEINEAVRRELERTAARSDLKEGFLRDVRSELDRMNRESHR